MIDELMQMARHCSTTVVVLHSFFRTGRAADSGHDGILYVPCFFET